jgi:hypothetical protein
MKQGMDSMSKSMLMVAKYRLKIMMIEKELLSLFLLLAIAEPENTVTRNE